MIANRSDKVFCLRELSAYDKRFAALRAIVAEQKLDQTIWGKEFHRLNAVNALRRLHAAIEADQ